MIVTKNVAWVFDMTAWGEAIAQWREDVGREFLAEYLDVSPTTIDQWVRPMSAYKKFPFPSMHNFIAVCNELELRPEHFFTTSE